MERHCNQPLKKFNAGGFMVLHACKVCAYGHFTQRERSGEEHE